MNLPKFPRLSAFRWRRALVWILSGLGIVLATLAVFLLLLPTLLSSPSVQQLLRPRLEAALGRSVEWESLELSWREGIRLSELRLGDGAAPLRRLHIAALETSFGAARSEIRPAQLFFNLRLSGLTAEVEPAPAGIEAPPAKAEADPEEILAELAARLQEIIDLGWELPVDLRIMIDAGPLAVHYRDPGSGETATVEDLYFTLSLPSLLTAPIHATSAADLAVDGHRLPSFHLATGISGLADIDGRLRPGGARVDLKAEFPGVSADLQGTLNGAGLSGGLRLQPSQILPVIQTFLAEPLPHVTGILSATLASEIVGAGDLRLHLGVQGDTLTATGGPLAQQRVGPLSFKLRQQVVTDQRRDTVAVEAGQLLIPDVLEAQWQAAIEHPLSKNRQLTANFGPLTIHLPGLLALAKPLMAADLPLAAVDGRLECDTLAFTAAGGGQTGELSLRGLRLLVDRFAARLPAGELTGSDLRLTLKNADLPLAAGFPVSAKLRTGYRLGALRIQGETPLEFSGLAGQADISVSQLTQQPASRFGVAARLAIEQDLSVDSLRLPGIIDLSKIEETLQVGMHADAQGALQIDLRSFALLAQGRPTVEKKLLPPFAVDVQAQGAKVRLSEEAFPQLRDLRLKLKFDPGLQLETLAEITPEQGGAVRSEGRLAVDAGALAAWLQALLPPGVAGEGLVDVAWQVEAKMPGAGFPDPAVVNPLRQARGVLDLLTAAELTLNIRNAAVRLGEISPVMASGINTPAPLHLSLRDGAQLASFELVGTVDRLTGLPGAAADFPPQQVRLVLHGEQRNLATARLTEELQVEPAGLAQVAELVVEKLDRLAELPGAPTAADLLRRLDASLFATLDLKLPERLPANAAPMQLAGNLAAGLRVDLEGGKQLRVGGFGDLTDLDVRLPEGPEVDSLNLRLVFNRLYAIGDRQKALPIPPWLSETVLAGAPSLPTVAAPLVAERLWQDLRGVSGRERSLTFGRARAQVAGFPLELSAGEGALQLDGLSPGLNYLQTGLLGGSLKARAGLDLAAVVPRVELLCAFSHLDTARLLPETVARETGAASEITGELALQLPLLDDSRQLLEKLDLRLHLWQIGSRTLERALFALDPYEQNEAIIEQRKMLRLGSLKQLRVTAADGSLSTAGEIEVKGVGIALPRIDRLNLASLPIESQLAEPLKSLPPLLSLLELAAANYLEIGDDGAVGLRRMGANAEYGNW